MRIFSFCLFIIFNSFTAFGQVCISLDSWSFVQNNGDGTCNYDVAVTIDSGNGASGDLTLSINSTVVYSTTSCVCNPTTIPFQITVACGTTIDIEGVYDAPGNGNDCSGFTGAIVLPVIWQSRLNVRINDHKSVLSFSTAQEVNNSHFEIEHSTNGIDFINIGKIEAVGDSNFENFYEYIHTELFRGTNFYRVKQVDNDGRFEYSNVARVSYLDDEFTIYPNPVQDVLKILSQRNSLLTIYNHLGQKINDKMLVSGFNELNLTGMESGVYYVRVNDKLRKIVKQ